MLSFSVASVFGLLLWPSCEDIPVLETLHQPFGLAQGRLLVTLLEGGMTRKQVNHLLGRADPFGGGIGIVEEYYPSYGINLCYRTATGWLKDEEMPEPRLIRVEWTLDRFQKPQYVRNWD